MTELEKHHKSAIECAELSDENTHKAYTADTYALRGILHELIAITELLSMIGTAWAMVEKDKHQVMMQFEDLHG